MASRAVLLALALPAVQAAVISSINALPAGWAVAPSSKLSKLAARSEATHVFSVALSLQNLDQLEAHLTDVSMPGGTGYGAHLDAAAIAATYGASEAAVQAVSAWLGSSSEVHSFAVRDSTFVDVVTTVAGANSLFNASYEYYVHTAASSESVKLRTLSYAVPDDVAEHVALIDPGNYFGSVQAFAPRSTLKMPPAPLDRRDDNDTASTIDYSCQLSVTPKCLKQMYNVGNYTPDVSSGSWVGFGSFLNESAQYADTFTFEDVNGIPAQNFTVELMTGGVDNQNITTASIGEANLDAQCIIGMAHPLPLVEYIAGGSPPFVPNIDQPTDADNQNEPYVPYFTYLLTKPDIPQVISNSYGDVEDSVPYNYAVYTCTLIGLLGLRGVTVLHSSGDIGVGAGCLAPDYKTVEFNAIFPASCPFVTSVGGTVAVTPEVAWEGSSGGFSKYFSRPSYQDKAVSTYLREQVNISTLAYYAPYTNWAGRGFPDVAAHSVDPYYAIVYKGKVGVSGGTSAAAPVWAGLIGLLNDARLRSGKSVLGWLNPLIYAYGPDVLTDITDGRSIGCNGVNTQTGEKLNGSGIVPGAFWNATAGWDPATGYGTPNFQKLLDLVLDL